MKIYNIYNEQLQIANLISSQIFCTIIVCLTITFWLKVIHQVTAQMEEETTLFTYNTFRGVQTYFVSYGYKFMQ